MTQINFKPIFPSPLGYVNFGNANKDLNKQTVLIAEVGVNHEGSITRAKKIIKVFEGIFNKKAQFQIEVMNKKRLMRMPILKDPILEECSRTISWRFISSAARERPFISSPSGERWFIPLQSTFPLKPCKDLCWMECSIGTQMRKQSVSDVKSTEPRSDLGSLSPANA